MTYCQRGRHRCARLDAALQLPKVVGCTRVGMSEGGGGVGQTWQSFQSFDRLNDVGGGFSSLRSRADAESSIFPGGFMFLKTQYCCSTVTLRNIDPVLTGRAIRAR